MKRAPQFLKKYFWDIDFAKLDLEARRPYVLVRVLEYGDEKAVRWMRRNFTREEAEGVLSRFRGVSPKSANYWALILDIDKKKILCLQKHYLEIRRRHWPY